MPYECKALRTDALSLHGPYYLAMVTPVLVLGSGVVAIGLCGLLVLGVLILAGSKIIWWATERAWGKFS